MPLLSLLVAASVGASAQPVVLSSSPAAGLSHAETPKHQDELRRTRIVLEDALKSDPSNDSLWLHLAFVEHKMGDLEAAQASFEKVVELDPGETGAHYMLALLYEKKGDKRRAVEAWQACVDRSKDPTLLSTARKHLKELKK